MRITSWVSLCSLQGKQDPFFSSCAHSWAVKWQHRMVVFFFVDGCFLFLLVFPLTGAVCLVGTCNSMERGLGWFESVLWSVYGSSSVWANKVWNNGQFVHKKFRNCSYYLFYAPELELPFFDAPSMLWLWKKRSYLEYKLDSILI
jgi:hypothetical protein